MDIFIRPLDTQFYRNGLPFDAGENNEASSFFPPFPRTLYGALRSKGILSAGGRLVQGDPTWGAEEHYGKFNAFGSLRLKGPFLARIPRNSNVSQEIYLPFPLDVAMSKEKPHKLQHLIPKQHPDKGIGWDLDDKEFMILNQPCDEFLSGKLLESIQNDYFLDFGYLGDNYLVHNDLSNYNKNDLEKCSVSNLFAKEYRIGIARDCNTLTAREGRLFRAGHTRLNDKPPNLFLEGCGLWAMIEGEESSFPSSGFLQLGGEFRAAYYQKTQDQDSNWWEWHKQEIINGIAETGRFKAYFITPAMFKRGCLPDVCEGSDKQIVLKMHGNQVGSLSFQLCALCTGKPKRVGGWDIQNKRPKAMLPVVPEGSVYFFKAEEKQWQAMSNTGKEKLSKKIYDTLNFSTWCSESQWGAGNSPGSEGFGIPLIGRW